MLDTRGVRVRRNVRNIFIFQDLDLSELEIKKTL